MDQTTGQEHKGLATVSAYVDRAEAVDALRLQMEAYAAQIRDLALSQPPIALLGAVLNHFHIATMFSPAGTDDDPRPNKEALGTFQFALEYLHAVWSCHAAPSDEAILDEKVVGQLLDLLEKLRETTIMFCVASSASPMEFHAKSTWVMIRGHRYQVLEEEFFQYVLTPHQETLLAAYGVGAAEIASGLQHIADAFRSGVSGSAERLLGFMDDAYSQAEAGETSLEAVLEGYMQERPEHVADIGAAIQDMLFGGVNNLSRHSKLPVPLLEDLSFAPGENTNFFAEGPYCGTPLRTLPAREKPAIKLGDTFYATDGAFIRDSAYRAIQWGLWKRLPSYRTEWTVRQARVVEEAFTSIFEDQLAGAAVHRSIWHREVGTGNWVEADLLIAFHDILFVVEAKAGVMPMQSPATHFGAHERVIRDLIVEAFQQCNRFITYLQSATEVELFHLIDGQYVPAGSIQRCDFRVVFPVGLTIEAFTPFSSMAKQMPEISPILGLHPFMSMSVDDLFVLRRFLPTAGQLCHYFEVRQAIAGIRGAHLFDEIDHLGAYINDNRFDANIEKQLEEADFVTVDGGSDIVDRYFEGEAWEEGPIPAQHFPPAVLDVLVALDRFRPKGWLKADSFLRDYGAEGRQDLVKQFDDLLPTLAQHPRRRFLINGHGALQVWLCRFDALPSESEVRFQAQVACVLMESAEVLAILLGFDPAGNIAMVHVLDVEEPKTEQENYVEISNEVGLQRARVRPISMG